MKTESLDEKQKFSTSMQRWASSAYRNFYLNHGLWVVVNTILMMYNLAQAVCGFVDNDIVHAIVSFAISFMLVWIIVFVQMDTILKCYKARKKLADHFKSIVQITPMYDTKNELYWYKLFYYIHDDVCVDDVEIRTKSDKYDSLSSMRSYLKWTIRSMIARGYEPVMLPWNCLVPQVCVD